MSKLGRSIIIDPAALSQENQDNLIEDLYLIHAEIFDGVSKPDFAHYVVKSSAPYTRIQGNRTFLS